MTEALNFPGGARFAFTVIDDTDVATVRNVEPLYRLLESLGFRTTKTVWPLRCPEGSPDFAASETLEDPEYLAFVRRLIEAGFELTWHGATMESSPRERTLRGLEAFHQLIGHYPRIHVNHSFNRENLYWGSQRVDIALLRVLFGRFSGLGRNHFLGHVPGSPFWWGDRAAQHCDYIRNLTFNEINLVRVNPSLPYRDPNRPVVPFWFSASDAEDVVAFNHLLRPENQERLEREGGVCIVATHFGKGFVREGEVDPVTQDLLRSLSVRRGWFPPVGELLDWLRGAGGGGTLPAAEWRRMQWRWAWDLLVRKWWERRRGRNDEPRGPTSGKMTG